MRYDQLPIPAQVFLYTYLNKNWRNRVKDNAHNRAMIDAYLAYKDATAQVAAAFQTLDAAHPDHAAIGNDIRAATDLYVNGTFDTARAGMVAALQRIVTAKAESDRGTRAATLQAQALAVAAPAGMTVPETTAFTTAQAAVGGAMTLPFPTADELATALGLLGTLRALVPLTDKVVGIAARATTACARLPVVDDTAAMRTALVQHNTARGTVPGDASLAAFAALITQADTYFDAALKSEQAPILAARSEWEVALKALTQAEALGDDVEDREDQIAAARLAVTQKQEAYTGMDRPEDGALAQRSADMLGTARAAGPLAANARRKIAPEFAGLTPQFEGAFDRNPDLAAHALEVACDVDDPTALANGIGALCDSVNRGFLIQAGDKKGMVLPGESPMRYGKAALEVGAHYGGTYFTDLAEYTTSGRMAEQPRFGARKPGETPGHQRSRAFADAILGEDGAIVLTPETLKPLRDDLRFHPTSLFQMGAGQPPSRETGLHIERTLAVLGDPDSPVAADVTKTLQAVEAPEPGSAGDALIRKSLGLGDDDPVDKTTAQKAILTALMSPVYQGPVGSCFSTAPVIGMRDQDPAAFAAAIAQIISTGTFTAKDSDPALTVPAVTRMPPDDTGDPLVRSLEYSVAAAGAVMEGSRQREKLGEASKLAVTGILEALMPGGRMADHSAVLDPIADELASEINKLVTFDYVPDDDVMAQAGGGDGRSTKGRFVLQEIGEDANTPIKDSATFLALFKKVAAEVVTADRIGADVLASFNESVDEDLADILGGNRRKPWDIEPGDTSDGALKVLYGGEAGAPSVTEDLPPAPNRGVRTAQVLGCVIGAVGDDAGGRETFGVSGVHAFSVLTDGDMFKTLKAGADDQLDARITQHLITPGKAIASAAIPSARAAKLFEKSVGEWIRPDAAEPVRKTLYADAMLLVPHTDVTPSALSDLVDTALAPFMDLRATQLVTGADTLPAVAGAPDTIRDRVAAVQAGVQRDMKAALIKDLAPPEIVLADANWGGEDRHDFFVMTTDPVSGAFDLWIRTEPTGTMKPVNDAYIEGDWRHCRK